MEIRLSLKCSLCSFIYKTKPNLKKHIDVHHKNKIAVEVPDVKKRQHNSYNCPECNSTFDSKRKMDNHLKDQHQGKTLSPERKVAKMNHEKVKAGDEEKDEKKKELENLQDLLVQIGKEKEEITTRLSNSNLTVLNLERANEALTQETTYLKAENEKSNKNLNDLDKEYITQIKDLKRSETQKEHKIIFLKAENEKCNRDINKIESAYKTEVIELKKIVDQKDIEIKILNDQRRREGMARVEHDTAADLHTSLEALVVTVDNGQVLTQDTSQAGPRDTSPTTPQGLNERTLQEGPRVGPENNTNTTEHEPAPEEEWQHQGRYGSRFECSICGRTRNTKHQMNKHMERSHVKEHIQENPEQLQETSDHEYNCKDCDFQQTIKMI